MPLTIINSSGTGGLKFINNNNSGGSTFFIASTGTSTPTSTPTPTPTPTPTLTVTPTPTPTSTPSYYAFSLTAGGIDSATACANSTSAITLYGSNISFQSNATFYSDYTLLSPYNGASLYYKNISNNQYVQIGSSGNQTAAGTC